MKDIAQLVTASACGDLQAYEQIIHRFQSMAAGYAYSILQDFHYAEDAAQEAFIEAFYHLDQLKTPAAFPGWFKKIVFKQCDRIRRWGRLVTVPLETGMQLPCSHPGPVEQYEQQEFKAQVNRIIQDLNPEQQLTVMLFYIENYSQQEIAGFLEVPVSTIKKRLYDARKKLEERMFTMLKETYNEYLPDEKFSKQVIQALLNRPKPLEVADHPVARVYRLLTEKLPGYECIQGDEKIAKEYIHSLGLETDSAYHPDKQHVLRWETTQTLLQAAAGRQTPVQLYTAGRVFRPDRENQNRSKVFNQYEVLHMAEGITKDDMLQQLHRLVQAVLPEAKLVIRVGVFPGFESGHGLAVVTGGRQENIGGCGMLSAELVNTCGLTAGVPGYSIGLGLDRLAMLKYNITDIHELYREPYV